MRIKVANVILLGGAFVVAGIASGTGISHYDGGDLSGLITFACLIIFVTTAAYLWSAGSLRGQRLEWEQLVTMLGGESPIWSASVHGSVKGVSVYARVESQNQHRHYLDSVADAYCDAKHFFALTVTLPYTGQEDWRIRYCPKREGQTKGEWQAVCEDSPALAQSLEAAGVTDFFTEWDRFTVLHCHAETGELTLRYPASHRFFCPSVAEVESEINLLRRAGAIWQHAIQPKIAA